MVRSRAGRSSLGCLFMLLLVVAAAYFGVNVGEAYWRSYQYQDAMKQTIRFADNLNDSTIVARLHAKADSLGLPDDAYDLDLERGHGVVSVSAEYQERVELPGVVRELTMRPHAEAEF